MAIERRFRWGSSSSGVVIALVGMQFARPMERPIPLAGNGKNGVDERTVHPVV